MSSAFSNTGQASTTRNNNNNRSSKKKKRVARNNSNNANQLRNEEINNAARNGSSKKKAKRAVSNKNGANAAKGVASAAAVASSTKRFSNNRHNMTLRRSNQNATVAAAPATSAAAAASSSSSSASSGAVVEEQNYVGTWQPLMTLDDEDKNAYVGYSPMLLSLHIVWPNANSKHGQVQGQISWHYGLLWASAQALGDHEQMFWPSGAQTEMITGDVTREGRNHLVFHFRTAYNGMGVLDPENRNEIAYTHERFETSRTYTFEHSPTPNPFSSAASRRGGASAAAAGAEAGSSAAEAAARSRPCLEGTIRIQAAQGHTSDDALVDAFPDAQVRLYPISHEAVEYSSTQKLLENFHVMHNEQIMRNLVELGAGEGSVYPQKLLDIITRIIKEPVNAKVRSINPDKLGIKLPLLLQALPMLGFVAQTESLSNGTAQRRLVWPETGDLLQLCDLYQTIAELV